MLNARAVELAIRVALATHCKVHAALGVRAQELLLPGPAEGLPDLAVRGAARDGRLARRARRRATARAHAARAAHAHPHGGGRRQVDPRRGDRRRRHPRRPEPRRRPAARDRLASPTCARPPRRSAYLRALRSLLRYVDVSDADMERGHFRCDANISLRRHGESRLGTRTELKNLNSFRFVEAALEAEIRRQAGDPRRRRQRGAGDAALRPGERAHARAAPQGERGRLPLLPRPGSRAARALGRADRGACARRCPSWPTRAASASSAQHGLSEDDARLLSESRALADFFEAAAARHGDARRRSPSGSGATCCARSASAGSRSRRRGSRPRRWPTWSQLVATGRVTAAERARRSCPSWCERGGDPLRAGARARPRGGLGRGRARGGRRRGARANTPATSQRSARARRRC